MGFTGQLGTGQSELGNIVLGSLPSGGVGVANFVAHVLDSQTVRVLFDRPMTASALVPGAYTIAAIGGPYFTPLVSSVVFYDAAQRSVAVTFAQSLTYGGTYTMGVIGAQAVDGSVPMSNTYNFAATVPDPPRAIGAYLSLRGMLDVVFDRPVGQYSVSAAASINDANSPATASLTLVPWTSAVPANNVRFSLPGSIPTTSSYVISFSGVQDISTNTAPGSVPLNLVLRSPIPYGISSLKQLQIEDAYVDRLSNDYLNLAYVRVFFNCPVNGLLATNPANWAVSQQGAHRLTDTVNPVALGNPVGAASLIAYANALKAGFNAHIAQPGVHLVDDNAPASGADVVRLANDLKAKANAHFQSLVEHSVKDVADLVATPDAVDLPSVITLLNAVKASFAAHSVASGVHTVNETEYVVSSPNAVDLPSAAVLADEIRIKFMMHDLNPNVHIATGLSQPSAPFSLPRVVYGNAVDVANAAGLLNELQLKYQDHIPDAAVHLYSDGSNAVTQASLTGASAAGASAPAYLAAAVSFAVALKVAFDGHLAATYPAAVSKILNYASSVAAFDVTSPHTWYCDVAVSATSPVPNFSVTASLTSEDGLSSTNPADYTGSIVARSLASPATILSDVYVPSATLTVKTDREIVVQDSASFTVAGPVGPVLVKAVRQATTPSAVLTLLYDLMGAYVIHLTAAGHPVTDTANVPSAGDFPTPSIASIVGQANKFKRTFDAHAASGKYHNFASLPPVTLADATDLPSAVTLIRTLRDAFIAHNANLGLHTSSGPVVVSAKGSDGVALDLDGTLDGAAYVATGSAVDVEINLSGPAPTHPFRMRVPFTGISPSPYLASAIPQVALLPTSIPSDPVHLPATRLGSDAVICFFSRPMRKADSEPSNVRVTGGILIKDAEWMDDRILTTHVTNMGSTSYQIDVSGFSDKQGNSLPPFSLPGP